MAAWAQRLLRVPVCIPAEISTARLMNYSTNSGEIRGDMVLESVFANVVKKLLHSRNLDDPGAAKSFQRIIRERSPADVSTNSSRLVIRREACIAHRAGFNAAHAGTEGIVLANGTGDDLLIVHLDVTEEVLRQITAVEADRLIRMAAVVIVPIEQSARRFGRQPQGMHAEHTADVHFAGA